MDFSWEGKRVGVTGAAGTIGKELLRQLLAFPLAGFVGIDNNESELFYLQEQYRAHGNVHLFLGDLRDRDTLVERFSGCDVVLHSAALKHVGLCERAPRDAVYTNILGTQNLIDAAASCGIGRVILTSSDKAVNPTNVMGTSKLMCERLMTAANPTRTANGSIFGSTRFGNVLGSRGSVVPLFTRQIASGGPVTLTHPGMTRFIMTLEEAVGLVLDSAFRFKGGEVLITKMAPVKIKDLAEIMIEELAPAFGRSPRSIEIETTGLRPGEKMFEELMNDEEVGHAFESDKYFIIEPALRPLMKSLPDYPGLEVWPAKKPYNSTNDRLMDRETLRTYLRAHGLLNGARE